MADRVMTAPLAIIKVNGVAIGKMRNIQITETVRLQTVVGIGRLAPDEIDPLSWNGTLNAGFFLVDMRQPVFPGAIQRVAQTVQDWENTLLFSDGVQVDIMRKIKTGVSLSGIVSTDLQIFASIKGAFPNRESFDITEQQISGRNVDFEYITPILFPI